MNIKTKIIIFILGCIPGSLFAQDVEWASSVIEFSSELSSKEYSAQQILGKPDVLPAGGDSPNAWIPANPSKEEYIKIGFEVPLRIRQIAIAESYNPSATYQLYAYDDQDNEYLINTFNPHPVELRGRLLNVFLEQTSYEVHALKLVLNGLSVPGYNGIDAIGISGSDIPVKAAIEEAPNISENIKSERLDENVNSKYQEIRPLIAPDGKTLYFSRRFHPENVGGTLDPEDIWYSEYDPAVNDWLEAKNLGKPLNNSGANFISSLTPDGNVMTVILGNRYDKNDRMVPGVSMSTKSVQGWSKPRELNIVNASIQNNDGDYYIAQNRKLLMMAVERFDSFGGKDIYVSFLSGDGTWTEPLNLGKNINTASTESSPFLAADDETLYFSSKGYSGYGEADIYMSRRLDDSWRNWSEPENLGGDINSPEDDIFFNIPPSGKYAYYSKSNTEYDADIYRIELPIFYRPAPVVAMKGKIIDAETNNPVQARISYELLPENTKVGHTQSDSLTGLYQIVLPTGSKYRYIIDMKGYNLMEDTIDLTGQLNYREIERDLLIDPMKLQQAVVMNMSAQNHNLSSNMNEKDNYVEVEGRKYEKVKDAIEINDGVLSVKVLFDFDSDVIRKNSYPDLNRVIEFLNTMPVNIILAGHTDSTGPDTYNLVLSERRARSVYQYLEDHGVPDEKIEIVGYGENRPVDTNNTIQGRRKNRRVDFIRKDQFDLYNRKYSGK